MTTSYTSLLGLALPVEGELSGTWGDTVNDFITQYLDASVAGTQTISGSQTAVTLSTTTGTALSQAGSGSTGSAQYFVINCTGAPASLLTITAPAASKPYIIINATSTNQSVKIVGAGPTTGVTVAPGQRALVAWNGTDFVQVGASAGGSNNQVQYNSGGSLAGSANLTFDGSSLTASNIANSKLQAYREYVNVVGTVSAATYNIDLSTANIFDITLGNNVTFTFTNPPTAGIAQNATILLRQDATGNRLATFTNASYTDGTAPVLSTGANQLDILTFFTVNGGSSYYGTFAMANVS